MHGLTDSELIERDTYYALWRTPELTFMWVTGVVDDARSAHWQATLKREFDRAGYPRFHAMDVSTVNPINSMQSRFKTASFVKATLERIEYSVVCAGMRPGPLVVCRALLRVVGMSNIELAGSDAEIAAAIASMRRGVSPRERVA